MAILHEATDANATFDRARPANPHRAIRRRMNKKGPRRQRGPRRDWRVVCVDKNRRQRVDTPDVVAGPVFVILHRHGEQFARLACIEERPRPRIAKPIRVRVAGEKIVDDIMRHIPVSLLATNLGQRPLNDRRVRPVIAVRINNKLDHVAPAHGQFVNGKRLFLANVDLPLGELRGRLTIQLGKLRGSIGERLFGLGHFLFQLGFSFGPLGHARV